MKRLFLHELQEQSKTLQETFSKSIFMVKRMKKVFPINIMVDKNLFLHLRINICHK